jgi:hypothetical protein
MRNFALFLATLSLSCVCIDSRQLKFSACLDNQCTDGLTCCADNTCRPDCAPFSLDGGGPTEVPDAGPGCSAANCPGCCANGVCQLGTAPTACGVAGNACASCGSGESCSDGVCSGCALSCTSGCCVGSSCSNPSVETCGAKGQACRNCGMQSDSCSATGQCQCGTEPSCRVGQRCSGGRCVCDATSCANGCCSNEGQCLLPAQQNEGQCGLGGLRCEGCNRPPAASCVDAKTLSASLSPGTCSAGACNYKAVTADCANGCENNACKNDMCQGCLTAPAPKCEGDRLLSYSAPGQCQNGATCVFAPTTTTCQFGCADGACKRNPCEGKICNSPPSADCKDANTRRSYASNGQCNSSGNCEYVPMEMTCSSPPPAECTGNVFRKYDLTGTCAGNGICNYQPRDTSCQFGCTANGCNGDPCGGVTCNMPPPTECVNTNVLRTRAPGVCAQGTCSYAPIETVCNNTPSPTCIGNTLQTYGAGECSQLVCNYPPANTPCPYGCANGACKANPCDNVTCNTPPPPRCENANTRQTFSPTGSCSGGQCNYPPTNETCDVVPAPVCLADGKTLRTFGAAFCNSSTSNCDNQVTDSMCPNGCAAGACQPCNATTCASGCCSGGVCFPGDSDDACGRNGTICKICTERNAECSSMRTCICPRTRDPAAICTPQN